MIGEGVLERAGQGYCSMPSAEWIRRNGKPPDVVHHTYPEKRRMLSVTDSTPKTLWRPCKLRCRLRLRCRSSPQVGLKCSCNVTSQR